MVMNKINLLIRIIAIIIFVQCTCLESFSGNTKPARSPKNKSMSYCGLFCLYSGMKYLGENIDFKDLLKNKYCSHADGSALSELQLAAKDHGIHAAPIKNVTTYFL